ncbi:MAG: hypothetical protein ABJN75_19490 [Hoeflea sp.]|uniref:hypothetical protein n=1 Tax=Hoeflea sp. TaxID=1940281 RepID=UPI003297477D
MSDRPSGSERTVALLKIQGLLAAAYDVARHTDNKFLSYLIKMARMEIRTRLNAPCSEFDETDNPDKLDRL